MSNIVDCLAAAPASLPMPGEADARPLNHQDDKDTLSQPSNSTPDAPPNQSPSPRPSEGRQASRRRSLEVVAEAQGDVDGFVKELDQKRRQLDDQIHKFIAQKEREFKLYERELRTRYRTQPSPATKPPGHASPTTPPTDQPVHAAANTQDVRATNDKSHERESELLGLFTPVYLPLLESRPSGPGRSPSAPALSDTADSTLISPDRQALHRANTDPAGDNKSLSSRRGLGPRTPSSGSDQGRSLVSALKSPSAGPRLSNKKRVSLVVGDEVVAPSDNIFSSANKDMDHHPDNEFGAEHIEVQTPAQPTRPETREPTSPKPPSLDTIESSTSQSPQTGGQPGGLSLGFASAARGPSVPQEPLQTKTSPQGDLELASPFSMDEEFDDIGSTEMYTTQIEDIDADIDSGLDSESTLRAASPASPSDRDISPVSHASSLNIPIASFGTSSSSSAQPISPGFSRPSVREDPQLQFDDQVPEELPAQGSLYGSFSRPSYSKQQTSGSLGESFMQRNAEKMMRRRQSVQRS
ncbi:unnamed protein product [Aureobasidium mustum]|uniref:Uncharacterized protein n=1 Tax=Aureobasidium mustum TaxID=2773714 RepID=A0A9N8K3J4_9PEZI|nr:unnamed protein product [Aureobasidium mustum]